MSLEERTLVVRNIDGDRLSADLLEELFANFGPVIKVVLRKSFAFIEYPNVETVGYAWAMANGITLQGRQLRLAPKLEDDPVYYKYRDLLQRFDSTLMNDRAYIDTLLTADQLVEKNKILSALNSKSENICASIRRRLRQYELHCDPGSTYNPILGRDLARELNRTSWDDSENQHLRHRSHSLEPDRRHSIGLYPMPPQQGPPPPPHQRNSFYHSQPDLNQTWHGPTPDYQNNHHHHQSPPGGFAPAPQHHQQPPPTYHPGPPQRHASFNDFNQPPPNHGPPDQYPPPPPDNFRHYSYPPPHPPPPPPKHHQSPPFVQHPQQQQHPNIPPHRNNRYW